MANVPRVQRTGALDLPDIEGRIYISDIQRQASLLYRAFSKKPLISSKN
jgi:hypothetical protein